MFGEQLDNQKKGKSSDEKSQKSAPLVEAVARPSDSDDVGRSRLRRFVSKPLRQTKVHRLHTLFRKGRKGNRVSESNDDCARSIFIPLDIIYEIAKHLNRVDYTVLRYACRDYYYMLPPVSKSLMADYCSISHLLSRLVDTNYLPIVYHRKHRTSPLTPPMSKEVVKRQLYRGHIDSCHLCNIFSFDDSLNKCPLHEQFDTRPKLPASRTPLELAFLRSGWYRGYGYHRIRTKEAYCDFLEKIAAAGHCHPIASTTSSDSYVYVLKPDDNSFPDSWVNYASDYTYSHMEPERRREIIQINCCCHCSNIIPEATAESGCPSCDCSVCGWTSVDILRVRVGHGIEPSLCYVPIGVMRDRESHRRNIARRLSK